ncbi:uncharacterized protein LOC107884431 [Acyrthosiphon pisum]|uniref:Uncharacterized protein n=1 Tax=Acyrthosiphon pisum TaxID=7029 RepID=A0A8R2H9W3_ACYPI|nr:uncharacterized protein LOC107884431 [Acyrthosiphon pisum]|eukprot:XP_016661952.1 PREDICTED: uncharacterized protein LOC107884431 [Acyrthosiphon pisum]
MRGSMQQPDYSKETISRNKNVDASYKKISVFGYAGYVRHYGDSHFTAHCMEKSRFQTLQPSSKTKLSVQVSQKSYYLFILKLGKKIRVSYQSKNSKSSPTFLNFDVTAEMNRCIVFLILFLFALKIVYIKIN